MEGDAQRAARLADIVERVLHRLGDSAQQIWTYEEILSYVELGGREMAVETKVMWDTAYLECLPPGFSATADWEVAYEAFSYGVAQFTMEDEEPFLAELELDIDEVRRANHTSPSELHLLEDAVASTEQDGVADLPERLVDVDRATYDEQWVPATTHHRMHRDDHRYQLTRGDVVAFAMEDEGYQRLRFIRVPNVMATIYEFDGSWGVARDVEDTTRDSVSGTWGIPRRVAGHHAFGDTVGFGLPRRFYQDDDNFKLEYWRQPRVEAGDSDLPTRYWLYLADYAQWRALFRNGAGQNYKLGQLYKDRWVRGLARITSRRERRSIQKVRRMGGDMGFSRNGPPRPRLPWQYGRQLR
jgi:hypothetical protein